MMRASAAPGAMTAPLPPAIRRPRSGAESHIAGLEAKLSIVAGQMEAWRAFADTLSANGHRMQSDSNHSHEPFGSLPDRLAALGSMRRAAERLFGLLHPAQQRVAAQSLPLCCLPRPGELTQSRTSRPSFRHHGPAIG
jgi:hypothetical protein